MQGASMRSLVGFLVFGICLNLGGADRSNEEKVQISLSGTGVLHVQSRHKVRHATHLDQVAHIGGDESVPTHAELGIDDQHMQHHDGLSGSALALGILGMNAILAVVLMKAELLSWVSPWSNLSAISETTVGIMKNLIGAGILCLPIAVSDMSIVGATVGMLFCCFSSLVGFLLIGFACDRFNVSSYGELMAAAFGKRYGCKLVNSSTNLVLLLHTLGGCVAYVTIIGDISTKLTHGYFLVPDLVLRSMCIVLITLLLLLPLCLHDQLKSLSMMSWLGIAVVLFVAGFCVKECIAFWDVTHSTELILSHLLVFKSGFFKAIPLINGAYMVHYNAPTFFAETNGRSLPAFATSALLAHVAASLIYVCVAFAGFARFGDAVHGNLLTSFEANRGHGALLCWVCMLLNMVLTVPLLFQRSRHCLMSFTNVLPEGLAAWMPFSKRFVYHSTTVLLLSFVAGCGIFFRHLEAIMLVREATFGVLLMYVFPAAACLMLLSEETQQNLEGRASKMSNDGLAQIKKVSSQETKSQAPAPGQGATVYKVLLCVSLLLTGVGSSCAALATVFFEPASL